MEPIAAAPPANTVANSACASASLVSERAALRTSFGNITVASGCVKNTRALPIMPAAA